MAGVTVQPGADLTPAIEAAKKASKWTTFRASDGELAIRQRTEDEWIEAMVEAAAPILLAELERQRDEALEPERKHSEHLAGDYFHGCRPCIEKAVTDAANYGATWALLGEAPAGAAHRTRRPNPPGPIELNADDLAGQHAGQAGHGDDRG